MAKALGFEPRKVGSIPTPPAMSKKKKVEKQEEVVRAETWGEYDVPKGMTKFKVELDYSHCWYEGDSPSVVITFVKDAT